MIAGKLLYSLFSFVETFYVMIKIPRCKMLSTSMLRSLRLCWRSSLCTLIGSDRPFIAGFATGSLIRTLV